MTAIFQIPAVKKRKDIESQASWKHVCVKHSLIYKRAFVFMSSLERRRTASVDDELLAALKRKSKKSALTALDVLAITRGLSDSTSERGENDPDDLERRIQRAVSGFLELSFNPP